MFLRERLHRQQNAADLYINIWIIAILSQFLLLDTTHQEMALLLLALGGLSLIGLTGALRVPRYCPVRTRGPHLYAQASLTDESVIPATFVSQDLYSILGILPNATNSEIKTRYKKIVSQTHPDRNSTPEALSIFRNATMAYTTLKDPKLRSKFDQKVKTKQVMDTLEETVVDVVGATKPLVVEASKRFMEDYLNPLSSSAAEFSSAALEATKAANIEDLSLGGIVEKWNKATDTFNEARLQKRYTTTLSSIQKALMAEQDAQKRIRSNRELLLRLNSSIATIVEEEAIRGDELNAINLILANETSDLRASTLVLNATRTSTEASITALSSISTSLEMNTASMNACVEERVQLEARLIELNQQEATLNAERGSFLRENDALSAVVDQQEAVLASCLEDVIRLESAVSIASEVHSEVEARYTEAKKERENREAAMVARVGYESSQEAKLSQQQKKKATLYETMQGLEKSIHKDKEKEKEKGARGRGAR